MFYDERIAAESGKIYKRGILIAILFTAFYAALRAVNLIQDDAFVLRVFTTELFILVAGAGILLYGWLRFRGAGDERTVREAHAYFFGAGKGFLIAALAGYALAIPFAESRGVGDFPPNHIILVLEFVGILYFYYTFKSREIPFNYTFIADGDYYPHVFRNIGKLALILLLPFGVAFLIENSLAESLVVLIAYLESVLGLGICYIFISRACKPFVLFFPWAPSSWSHMRFIGMAGLRRAS